MAIARFRGRALPEPATLAGYAALIDRYDLRLPLPAQLCAIAERHRPVSTSAWQLLGPRRAPEPTLGGQLELALKREGVDLLVLAVLFQRVEPGEIAEIVRAAPTGRYSRRIWFLYEWLTGIEVDLPHAPKVAAVPAVDPGLQYALASGEISARHRVENNLPGTPDFCPLVWRTATLGAAERLKLADRAAKAWRGVSPALIPRAENALLQGEAQASARLEGDAPTGSRDARWGRVAAEAREQPLELELLFDLQRQALGENPYLRPGFRRLDSYLGTRHPVSGDPLPEGIGARPDDLPTLVTGVLAYCGRCEEGGIDPVVAAAAAGFGLAYIHPLEDGNGRLVRWLIQRQLQRAGFAPAGANLPLSHAILRDREGWEGTLRAGSLPLVELCIDWKPDEDGEIRVSNDTAPYYRFFDATEHAETLYRYVREAVETDLPRNLQYLQHHSRFDAALARSFDMPQATVRDLFDLLRTSGGLLADAALPSSLSPLSAREREQLEEIYEITSYDIDTGATTR